MENILHSKYKWPHSLLGHISYLTAISDASLASFSLHLVLLHQGSFQSFPAKSVPTCLLSIYNRGIHCKNARKKMKTRKESVCYS